MSASAKQALPERSVLGQRLSFGSLMALVTLLGVAFAQRLLQGDANLGLAAAMPLLLTIFPAHARARFATADATEWLLVVGVWTRKRLALWFSVDEACRAGLSLAAVAALRQLDLFAADTEGLKVWCVAFAARELGMLVMHVPGCAWMPSWMRSLRWSFRSFRLSDFASLSKGVASVLLIAAPLVALAWATRSVWSLVPCAIGLMLFTSACIASSEPVSALAYASSKARRGERQVPQSRPFSPRAALLWHALDAKGLLFIASFVSCFVAPLIALTGVFMLVPGGVWVAATCTGIWFVSMAIVVFLPEYGIWSWKSDGATAEYLEGLGVKRRNLRRHELLLGASAALVPVVWMVAVVSMELLINKSTGPVAWGVAALLSGIPLLACNRGFIRLSPRRSFRSQELVKPLLIGRCCLYVASYVLLSRLTSGFNVRLAVSQFVVIVELAVLAFALWRWLAAWSQTRDETWLRQSEIEGPQAANETRARARAAEPRRAAEAAQ